MKLVLVKKFSLRLDGNATIRSELSAGKKECFSFFGWCAV